MPKKNLVGGEWRGSDDILEARFPWDGSVVDAVSMASQQDMHDAMAAAQDGFAITRALPSHKRSEILSNMVSLLRQRFDEVVEAMILEGGKNRKTAIGETARALETLKISSEEARRIGGEVFSTDWTPAGENRQAFTRRQPIGTVLGITPFNYPVNLACHKIGSRHRVWQRLYHQARRKDAAVDADPGGDRARSWLSAASRQRAECLGARL